MLQNGVFVLFFELALTIFFIFHMMTVEDNGAHYLRYIAIVEKLLSGMNLGIKNGLAILVFLTKRIFNEIIVDFRKHQGKLFEGIFNFSHLLIRGTIKGLETEWRFFCELPQRIFHSILLILENS